MTYTDQSATDPYILGEPMGEKAAFVFGLILGFCVGLPLLYHALQ